MNSVVAKADHCVRTGVEIVHLAEISQTFVAPDERKHQFHASR